MHTTARHTTAEQISHTNTERVTAQRRLLVEVVVAAPRIVVVRGRSVLSSINSYKCLQLLINLPYLFWMATSPLRCATPPPGDLDIPYYRYDLLFVVLAAAVAEW